MGVSERDRRRLLTVDEVAEMLRVKPYLVVRKCREKELRATKPFGSWLIDADDVEALLERKANLRDDGEPEPESQGVT